MNFFDLHCDTAFECYKNNEEFYVNSLAISGEAADFKKWKQVFAVWIRDDHPEPFEFYQTVLTDIKQKLLKKPSFLTEFFSVEGGAVLEDDSDRLYILKNDQIKLLTLCWNGENLIAGGSKTEKGLTAFGKEVVSKMNRLKMACDLSHLNEKSFYAALEVADFPLASHSCSRFVFNHQRNLYDDQIKQLSQKNGIIGLCFYPEFLGENVFEAIYRNIFHLLDMGLENHIAIGSDFDGGQMDKTLNSIKLVPNLYTFLQTKGLKEDLLNKIFYENADNFIAKL